VVREQLDMRERDGRPMPAALAQRRLSFFSRRSDAAGAAFGSRRRGLVAKRRLAAIQGANDPVVVEKPELSPDLLGAGTAARSTTHGHR